MAKLFFDLDGIEYARCAVIANGKDWYYEILHNPKEVLQDLEFEALLYVAAMAYELKTNEEFDYVSKYDYETFSNKEKWKE